MKSHSLRTPIVWLPSFSLLPFILSNQSALAACSLIPTAGNDTYICDSGTGGPLK